MGAGEGESGRKLRYAEGERERERERDTVAAGIVSITHPRLLQPSSNMHTNVHPALQAKLKAEEE